MKIGSLESECSSRLKDIPARISLGQYVPALNSLRAVLAQIRLELRATEWRLFCSESNPFQDQSLSRILTEGPLSNGRGLIHQPLLLDLIYGKAGGVPRLLTPLAHALWQWELSLEFCETLRARRAYLAGEI